MQRKRLWLSRCLGIGLGKAMPSGDTEAFGRAGNPLPTRVFSMIYNMVHVSRTHGTLASGQFSQSLEID